MFNKWFLSVTCTFVSFTFDFTRGGTGPHVGEDWATHGGLGHNMIAKFLKCTIILF